jgi:hypothetical protein
MCSFLIYNVLIANQSAKITDVASYRVVPLPVACLQFPLETVREEDCLFARYVIGLLEFVWSIPSFVFHSRTILIEEGERWHQSINLPICSFANKQSKKRIAEFRDSLKLRQNGLDEFFNPLYSRQIFILS